MLDEERLRYVGSVVLGLNDTLVELTGVLAGLTLASRDVKLIAVLIIAAFNYYVSVAMDQPFRSRFFEMAGLSLGVAALSFIIGNFIRLWLGVDI